MSGHGAGAPPPPRAELAAFAAQPYPARGQEGGAWIAAIVGLLIFLIYLGLDADRAWRAFYVELALLRRGSSSAGVTLAAVQRIATARWSREVVRFVEGFVAFLPVAFVFLVLIVTLGYSHIFPLAHVMPPVEEKRFYLAPGFFIPRVLILFAVIMILAVWFVYTSVRLDVGVVPEAGASWAAGHPRGADAACSLATSDGDLHDALGGRCACAVFDNPDVWLLLGSPGVRSLDVPRHALREHAVRLVVVHDGVDRCDHGLFVAHHVVAQDPAWGVAGPGAPLPRPRQARGLCSMACSGLPDVRPVLVLWYGNMGEETHFFRLRAILPWAPLTAIVATLTFVLPFFGLLSRAAKVYLPTFALFAFSSIIGIWLQRYGEVYPSLYGIPARMPLGIPELGVLLLYLGVWGTLLAPADAFPKVRVFLMTSQYRDEVQVPVDPRTMPSRCQQRNKFRRRK